LATPPQTSNCLVDFLYSTRIYGSDIFSAVKHDKMVGHVLFSTATIENSNESFLVLVLSPVAVLPEFQNQGIGTKLIETKPFPHKLRRCLCSL